VAPGIDRPGDVRYIGRLSRAAPERPLHLLDRRRSLPNVKSAIKRVKTSQTRRARNRRDRARLRTALKRTRESSDGETARANLKQAESLLDRSARKGIIHPNKAARDKSRLARLARKLAGGEGESTA
jgi:small subunit ribosomal protein S20